jgi:hypothetical protein
MRSRSSTSHIYSSRTVVPNTFYGVLGECPRPRTGFGNVAERQLPVRIAHYATVKIGKFRASGAHARRQTPTPPIAQKSVASGSGEHRWQVVEIAELSL